MKIRSAYDGSRVEVLVICGDPVAKQDMAAECDVNNIIAQYKRTGLLRSVEARPSFYQDVSEMGDYREALNAVRAAEELFMELPSATRAEFENDPALFLSFASNEENEDYLRSLGLLPKLPVTVEGSETPSAGGGEQGPNGAAVEPGDQASEA